MTRIYFVATRPDIVKAFHDKIYHDGKEAEIVVQHLKFIFGSGLRVYSALVEVEKDKQ